MAEYMIRKPPYNIHLLEGKNMGKTIYGKNLKTGVMVMLIDDFSRFESTMWIHINET